MQVFTSRSSADRQPIISAIELFKSHFSETTFGFTLKKSERIFSPILIKKLLCSYATSSAIAPRITQPSLHDANDVLNFLKNAFAPTTLRLQARPYGKPAGIPLSIICIATGV